LPVAADSLRASRSQDSTREGICIAAADPLNLVGIILPGDRIPANSGRSFTLRDGLVAESDPRPLESLRNAHAV
jgi:ATP-dependent Lhr-like helicase